MGTVKFVEETSAQDARGSSGQEQPVPGEGREPALRQRGKFKALPRSSTALPPVGVIALNRMGFGPKPGDLEAFYALGPDDISRLTQYVDQQLDPAGIDDSAADQRFADSGYFTYEKDLNQLWTDHFLSFQDYEQHIRPAREVECATLMRAIHSKRQLFEALVGFWHDHFNVLGWDFTVAPFLTHYDRDVIRGHALGNFRDLLEEVARSPVMLYYLDNHRNTNAGPNENFARELFELHTLGADRYLGVASQLDVPVDGEGVPVGYVDGDIYEATRCLTGWMVDEGCCNSAGSFLYRGDLHDRFQKLVLGRFISADQPPLKDGRDVLDFLARHPGTATHIATKLCRRFIGENPAAEVIEAAAVTFRAEVDSPDQIARVVRTILLSEAFRTTWGQKAKRPFEILVSSLRALAGKFDFMIGNSGAEALLYRYQHSGHRLFAWAFPNGYPETRVAWVSHTPRVNCWRLINWLVVARDMNDQLRLDALAQTPPEVRSATRLVDYWIDRILGRPMLEEDRQEILEFMAQGINPDFDLPLETDQILQERLQAMVALLMMCPDFLVR